MPKIHNVLVFFLIFLFLLWLIKMYSFAYNELLRVPCVLCGEIFELKLFF